MPLAPRRTGVDASPRARRNLPGRFTPRLRSAAPLKRARCPARSRLRATHHVASAAAAAPAPTETHPCSRRKPIHRPSAPCRAARLLRWLARTRSPARRPSRPDPATTRCPPRPALGRAVTSPRWKACAHYRLASSRTRPATEVRAYSGAKRARACARAMTSPLPGSPPARAMTSPPPGPPRALAHRRHLADLASGSAASVPARRRAIAASTTLRPYTSSAASRL